MTAAATSPHRALAERGTWGRFFAFVRRPVLPDRASGLVARAFPVVGKLFLLDVAIMATLIALASLAQKLGIAFPDNLVSHLKLTPALVAFMALGAPLAEETLFRGWLSGRPGHIGALLGLLLTGTAAYLAVNGGASAGRALAAVGITVGGLALTAWWLWHCRKRPAWEWFQRHFAWFYFGTTALFAAAHMTNFAAGSSWAALPLTLPQFSIGLMLGHLRVRYGLWSSMLLHLLHNSLFLLLILNGSSGG